MSGVLQVWQGCICLETDASMVFDGLLSCTLVTAGF